MLERRGEISKGDKIIIGALGEIVDGVSKQKMMLPKAFKNFDNKFSLLNLD